MNKPIISIKLSPKNYAGLVNFGNRVAASLAGNLNFATPLPTILALQAAITDVVNAIAVWGPRGNRGSHADLLDLRQKALTLAQILKSLSQYVQNTAQTAAGSDYVLMGAITTTSGYQLANPRTPQGILQKVEGFHNFISRKLNPNEVKLKWKKPLNVATNGNVKSYKVLRGITTDVTAAVEVAITTKGSFTDTNTAATAVVWTYWVVAYNTNGAGVVSDPITVAVLGA